MTKEQAIQLMEQGKKVTHRFFSPCEFITIKDSKIITEEGYSISMKEFWAYRNADSWNDGWEEFVESKPIPSPGDNQSLEEAAKAAAQESWDNRKSKGETEFASAVDYIVGYIDGFLAGAAYVKGGEEKGLTKEEIAQICEMADNDYAAQEAILFAEFLRKNNMGPNGFGGWGGGDINTNYYGSTEVKLYELFKKRPLASRPSLDIDKVVGELRVANPYEQKDEMPWETSRIEVWNKCCNKLSELLNQQK